MAVPDARTRRPAARRPDFGRAAARIGVCLVTLLLGACASPEAPPPQKPRLSPDLIQRGALLFRDPRVSGDGSRSCTSCHPGGGSDDLVYLDGVAVEPGTPGGRRTASLRGLWQSPPYLRDGSAATAREALERALSIDMRGARLPEHDVAALESYILSIPPYDNGRIEPDGAPVEPATLSARRGFEVFKRSGCDECHAGPGFTRRRLFAIDTDASWSVPSLRGVSKRPPLGHDGRWKDLEAAVRAVLEARDVELTNAELHQLLTYLRLL